MDVLILTVFVSVVLVIGEIVFFAWNLHHGSHDHAERLSLLPLEQDTRPVPPSHSTHSTHSGRATHAKREQESHRS